MSDNLISEQNYDSQQLFNVLHGDPMHKITPFLWFDTQAEDAANFYVTVFRNSKILNVARYGVAGSAELIVDALRCLQHMGPETQFGESPPEACVTREVSR